MPQSLPPQSSFSSTYHIFPIGLLLAQHIVLACSIGLSAQERFLKVLGQSGQSTGTRKASHAICCWPRWKIGLAPRQRLDQNPAPRWAGLKSFCGGNSALFKGLAENGRKRHVQAPPTGSRPRSGFAKGRVLARCSARAVCRLGHLDFANQGD